jgi:preprotein translocase YajC subunit
MNNINSYIDTANGKTAPSSWASIVQMVFIGILFIGLMFWSRRKTKHGEEKKMQLINNLQIGDTIQTSSGIIGVISFISQDKKMIEIRTGIAFSNPITISSEAVIGKFNQEEEKVSSNNAIKE